MTDWVMTDQAITLAEAGTNVVEIAVREHSRLLYRIVYSVLRDAAEAEDAVQETFMRAVQYKRKLAWVDDPKAWLARIAWRIAVERRTGLIRRSTLPIEVVELPSPVSHADDRLLEAERQATLQHFLASLPEALRDPLVLSALQELSPREVGEMLEISEAAVRSRSFRARQILREKMLAWMGARK